MSIKEKLAQTQKQSEKVVYNNLHVTPSEFKRFQAMAKGLGITQRALFNLALDAIEEAAE